jgi:fructosamine-3-kinase
MRAATKRAIGSAMGSEVVVARSVGGGSINEAYACELADGRPVFVKANAGGDPRMFPLEERGLKWLDEAGALRTPKVFAVNKPSGDVPFLVMELIEPGPRSSSYDVDLGRRLAALHGFGAPSFGLDHDNYLATLEQDNTPADTWPEFYARRRLEPQVRLAIDTRSGPPRWAKQFEQLYARLDDLVASAATRS